MSNYGAPPPPGYGPPPPPPGFGPSGYGMGGPAPGPVYADMGRRLVAWIIDGLLLGVLFTILGFILLGGAATQLSVDEETQEVSGMGAFFGAYFGYIVLVAVLSLAYQVVLIALRGATIGKQVMGIQVVRESDLGIPGWGPSVLRWLVPFAGSLVCGIGQLIVYVSPFFDSTGRNQGWHDKVAHTFVISRR